MPTGAIAQPPAINRSAIALGALAAALAGAVLLVGLATSFLWPPSELEAPTDHVYLGRITKYAINKPVFFDENGAKFWLIRTGDETAIALSAKDAHSGCTLPWRPDFTFEDPRTHASTKGWFRDPCHGSTYDIVGHRVFGPSPRDMDVYPAKLEGKNVVVTTNVVRGLSSH